MGFLAGKAGVLQAARAAAALPPDMHPDDPCVLGALVTVTAGGLGCSFPGVFPKHSLRAARHGVA